MGVNVASGQITGTTTAMQYSLNSTNGVDGDWFTASATNTPVTFTAGKVYVRQTAVPTNLSLVATIEAAAVAPAAPTVTKKAGDATGLVYEINVANTLEWSIDGGTTWTTGTGAAQVVNIPVGGATVSLRTKATASALASAASTKVYAAQAVAPAAPAAPTLTKKADASANVYQINVADTFEWSLDGTTWTTGTGALQDMTIPLVGATVSLRTKATDNVVASAASTKVYAAQAIAPAAPTVTKKADGSANVYQINVANILEWSLDGTTWTTGTSVAQDVTIPLTGGTISLRTKATDNVIASAASTKVYAAQALAPSVVLSDQNNGVATFRIGTPTSSQVATADGYEYSTDSTTWTDIADATTVDSIGAKTFYVRVKATASTLASQQTVDLDTQD